MKVLFAAAVVAVGLVFLLVWRSPLITRGVYQIGFLLGLATFAAILLSPGSALMVHTGRSPLASLGLIPLTFVAMTPYLLLVESGIAGYRGFSSWMRYASLVLAVLGSIGLVASFLLPRLLRG